MAHKWRSSTTFIRLDIGPGKSVSLNMINGGSVIAMQMKMSNFDKVIKVTWAKHNGYVYRRHLVVCGEVLCEMPVLPD